MVVGICDDHAEERERIYKVCEMVFGKSRKTEIPLVPFLLAGYIGAVLL